EDPDRRKRVLGASLLLAVLALATGAVMLAAARGWLGGALGVQSAWLVPLITIAGLVDVITALSLANAQAAFASPFFVSVSLAQLVVKVTLGVLFVVGFGWGTLGVAFAGLLRSGCFACFLISREARNGLLLPDWTTVRDITRFLLPFVPGGLCTF